jgi:hypothetical protein
LRYETEHKNNERLKQQLHRLKVGSTLSHCGAEVLRPHQFLLQKLNQQGITAAKLYNLGEFPDQNNIFCYFLAIHG